MHDLICFGEIIYDNYKDKKVLAGAPLNVASFCAALGLKTGLISAVNDRKIIDTIEKRGIKSYVQVNKYPSGEAFVKLNKDKIPGFVIKKNTAFDHIKHVKIPDTGFFYFGTLAQRNKESRNSLYKMLEESKAVKVCDLNLREGYSAKILKKSVQHADIIKANEEELKKIEKYITDELVFVTEGSKGAYIYGTDIYAKSPKVKVVDTTGCGDAFTAGMIYGIVCII